VLVAGCWSSGEVPTKSGTTIAASGSATSGDAATALSGDAAPALSDAGVDAFVVGRTKCDDDPRASGCNPPPPAGDPELQPLRGRVTSIVSVTQDQLIFVVLFGPGKVDPSWRGVFLDETTNAEIPNTAFTVIEKGKTHVRCEIRGTNGKLPSKAVRLDPKRL
jgi:hypothetical protein